MKKSGPHLWAGWRSVAIICCALVVSSYATAQSPVHVKGKVTDGTTQEPIIGATVVIKGTSTGTSTNERGEYALQVPAGATALEFSYLGYSKREVEWRSTMTTVDVQMEMDAIMSEEVVVVGYGSQRRSDVTGSIATISKARIEEMPVASVSQMLQGAVAGLNFTTNSAGANPDEDNIMLIRGQNSINASNDPLLVLDGVIYNGSLSDISTNDIQDISILKDASSAAIYGSRAAAGVILITTKQGQKGEPTVRYEGYVSFVDVDNFPRLFNVEEYAIFKNYQKSSYDEYDPDDPGTWSLSPFESETLRMIRDGSYKYNSWRDLILRKGLSHKHSLSISGGGDRSRYSISASMLDTKGVVQGNDYTKYNARFSLTSEISKAITFNMTGNYSYSDNGGATPNFADAYNKSPLYRPLNEDGSVNIYPGGPTATNVINPLENYYYDNLDRSYTANVSPNLTVRLPFEGLKYEFRGNAQYGTKDKALYYPISTRIGSGTNGHAETSNNQRVTLGFDNILTYQRDIKKHAVFLTGMFGIEYKQDKTNELTAQQFANDLNSWYGAQQAGLQMSEYGFNEIKMLSTMFRANYAFDSRYLFTYTFRYDGASVFGKNNKYAGFHSVALGWNISNEKFFEPLTGVVDLLKLRASYGTNGQMGISPYQTIAQLNDKNGAITGEDNTASSNYVHGGTLAAGYVPATIGTPGLTWETTRGFNLGLDFSFLNGRINGDLNLYSNYTYDLLLERSISSVHGIVSVMENIGKTKNEGIEVTLRSTNISQKDFSWSTDFTFSYNKNMILDLYGNGSDDIANKWFLGKPIRSNYDLYITGTWQSHEAALAKRYSAEPGFAKYDDYDNDGEYTDNDRQYLGTPVPAMTMGLTNTLRYKNISLMVLLYGVIGATKSNTYYDNGAYIWRDYWTPNNPTNEFWSADSAANQYAMGRSAKPSRFENTDFLRVKEIMLRYELPQKWTGKLSLQRAGVYVSLRNPWTVTSYGGLDPELADKRGKPLYKEIMLGLNLSF